MLADSSLQSLRRLRLRPGSAPLLSQNLNYILNMDKTAWIVVSLCVALLGVNWYYNDNSQRRSAASAAVSQTVARSEAPSPQSTTAGNEETRPVMPAAETVAASPVPQRVYTLTSKNKEGKEIARFHFQDVGGSLATVEMVDQPINSTKEQLHGNVNINSFEKQGIGTLMFGLSNDRSPRFDEAVYRVLPEASNDKKVTLIGRVGNLVVLKEYALKDVKDDEGRSVEGSAYALNLNICLQNTTEQALQGVDWGLFAGGTTRLSSDESGYHTYYVTMADGSFTKESSGSFSGWFTKDRARLYERDVKGFEWAGVMNQYYASIVQPNQASNGHAFYAAPVKYSLPVTHEASEGVQVALGVPDFSLAPKTSASMGGQHSFSYSIFTGPKLNLMLHEMDGDFHGLSNIMDYGIFTVISYPMNWLINVVHGWLGNWGWAIVVMTFVVRLLIWPLYRKSYHSMKRMSLLQPKMKELKEKYPNDQQKVSMEMMNLYKEYGVSPVGGCLPMLLQMPIFLAFFWVLQTAAEFRGAPWLGWVTDLSQMDTVCTIPLFGYELPVNVLPILMAVSMVVQMGMSPSAGDPTQQRIMKLMPLFFFAFCYTYASALALYWTTTNIISIIQTFIIRRLPEPELKKVQPKKGGKKGFMERMMEAQKAALEAQQKQAQMRNVTKKN